MNNSSSFGYIGVLSEVSYWFPPLYVAQIELTQALLLGPNPP